MRFFRFAALLSFLCVSGWSQRPAVAVFVAKPHGIDPPLVIQPTGKVVLIIVNRSRMRLTTFTIDDAASKKRIHDFAVSSSQAEWQETLDLPVGRYILSEANNPSFTSTLVVK
jgi:hypothetical protein